MVDAVVSRGVTPLPQTIFGVTVPLQRIACAPVGGVAFDFEVEKNEAVPEPPVPAGQSIFAVGVIVPVVSSHPGVAVVRGTLIRV
jgi:hypothetical protein